jgi:short-subunit dehydrogenase
MELRGTGIMLQVIAPGFVQTHFHDRITNTDEKVKKTGFLRWMTTDQVVEASLRSLDRGKVVCIPGLRNRIICCLGKYTPRWLYYRLFGRV